MTTLRSPRTTQLRRRPVALALGLAAAALLIAIGALTVVFGNGNSGVSPFASMPTLVPAGDGLKWSAAVVSGGISDYTNLVAVADQDTNTPSVSVVDATSGFVVAKVTTGYLPNAALIANNQRLVVVDHLLAIDPHDGYVSNYNENYPRVLVFDLQPAFRLVQQAPVVGYAATMYLPGIIVSQNERYLYYPIPSVVPDGQQSCSSLIVGDPCNRDKMAIGALDLLTLESSVAAPDLGAGCGAIWFGVVRGSAILATCAGSGRATIIDASAGPGSNVIVSSPKAIPLDTDPGRTKTNALGQGGFPLPGGGAGVLFGDGSFLYSDAVGVPHELVITPTGRRVSSVVAPILMADKRTLVIPLATNAAESEADGLAIFDLAQMKSIRTIAIGEMYSLRALPSGQVLIIAEAGELLTVDINTGSVTRVGGSSFQGQVLQR